MNSQKLALGTAQFGMAYGIANQYGQVPLDEVRAILELAYTSGVTTLDTAISYGESETCLGQVGVEGWQIITKLPPLSQQSLEGLTIREWVKNSCLASCDRLKVKHLYGLLLHRPQNLLEPRGDELYEALRAVKAAGWVQKIGISIYSPEELEQIYHRFPVDLVQAPFNGLDQRLVKSGWLTKLKKDGVEAHARSIFLQGLLLLSPMARPRKFDRWSNLWQELETWMKQAGISPLQACLGAAFHQLGFDRILIGIDHVQQLQEIISILQGRLPHWPEELSCNDLDLIDPRRWEKL